MMMKSLLFALGALFFDLAAATNHEVFCGLEPCLIPLELSCERMMEDYVFQGSCCSLESIVLTKGCRVKVYAGGNCAWIPRCEECDPRNKCNIIYSTINQEACPASDYPVLEGPAPGPTNPPLPDGAESNYPTMFPTLMPVCPPEPTNPPVGGTEPPTDPAATLGMMVVILSLALSTIYIML